MGEYTFRIYSQMDDGWSLHCQGTIMPLADGGETEPLVHEFNDQPPIAKDYYEKLEGLGVQLGPWLQCLSAISSGKQEVTA